MSTNCWIALAIAAMIASGANAVRIVETGMQDDAPGNHPPHSAATQTPHPATPVVAAPSRAGVASTYGPGWDGWLALPEGPGVQVTVCGQGGCVTRISNDAGPSLAMQRRGRIVDLDVPTFEQVCGVPWTRGLCRVTVTYR